MRGMYETVGGQIEPPRLRPPLLPLPPSPLRHFVPPRLRPPLLRQSNEKNNNATLTALLFTSYKHS